MQEEDCVWVYSMRREMQEIIPRLYLGPYSSATKSKGCLKIHLCNQLLLIQIQLPPFFPRISSEPLILSFLLRLQYLKNKWPQSPCAAVEALLKRLLSCPTRLLEVHWVRESLALQLKYYSPSDLLFNYVLQTLLDTGITHIVCIRQDVEARLVRPMFPTVVKYLVLNVSDSAGENIIQHFPLVNRYLDECFHSGGKALVHGNGGISRSAAFVLAYVMQKYQISFKEAFRIVQSKRFCVSPNEAFVSQLEEYEPIYRAQKAFANSLNCHGGLRRKRSIDDDPSRMDAGNDL